jgi:O-antigen/teichoic acid export membrane protein
MKASNSLSSDLKSVGVKSIIYGLGSILLRGINLLVLPLYTHYLTPEDYGIVAISASLTALLSLIMPVSLYSAILPFFFKMESKSNVRRMMGTIWLGMIGGGLLIGVAFEIFGVRIFDIIFPQLVFNPYGQISIWTAFFAIFSFLPLNLLQAEEKPQQYVYWTSSALLLTVALTVIFVVVLEQGAYGYLLGTLVANIFMAIPFTVMTLKKIEFKIDFSYLKEALIFSLPLLPHGISNWVLAVSDRAILQFYVSVSALGIYSLGYTFGMIQIFIGVAITQAWIPFLFKRIAEEGESSEPRLARMITYYVLFFSAVAIGLSLFSKDLINVLTNESFHSAADIVPIIVVAYLWNGLYIIPLNFLILKNRTVLVPLVTIPAALINIAINITFVPIYGIIAAAWATFFAFLSQLIIIQIIAMKVYPFPYEFRRILAILFVSGLTISISLFLNISPWADFFIKILLFSLIPFALIFGGFLFKEEKLFLKKELQNISGFLG